MTTLQKLSLGIALGCALFAVGLHDAASAGYARGEHDAAEKFGAAAQAAYTAGYARGEHAAAEKAKAALR